MRVVALMAVRNEERFIGAALDHWRNQGVDVYVLDHGSTDRTRELIAQRLGRGGLHCEAFPWQGLYDLEALLRRKEELAAELPADWFIHVDADEFHVSSVPGQTVAEALSEAGAEGYNAVNFIECTFVPTREEPDHDHPRFQDTMRWYYPFLPAFPHRLNAWRAQPRVDLVSDGGHRIRFPGLRMSPRSLRMKHYLFLSARHAAEKYGRRPHRPDLVARGWHGWRARFDPSGLVLPAQAQLRECPGRVPLDVSSPWDRHVLDRPAQRTHVSSTAWPPPPAPSGGCPR